MNEEFSAGMAIINLLARQFSHQLFDLTKKNFCPGVHPRLPSGRSGELAVAVGVGLLMVQRYVFSIFHFYFHFLLSTFAFQC